MRRFCSTLLPFLAFGLVLLAGCDSGGTTVPGSLGDSTRVGFSEAEAAVGEDAGGYAVEILAYDPGHKEFTADVTVNQEQSTATLGEDVTGIGADTTITFPRSTTDGGEQFLGVEVVDDQNYLEGTETLVFSVSGGSGISTASQGSFTLTVEENDNEFFEDFGDGTLGNMDSVSVASNAGWETSSEGGADNVPYAVANGFGANEASNDWLITPAFNFNAYTGETLTFLNAKGFNDSGRRGLQVKVSTDYDGEGNPQDFTWTNVSDQVTFSQGNFQFVSSGEVDLSGSEFQGDEVYVAFQYQSSGAFNSAAWEVDDIQVTGTPSN